MKTIPMILVACCLVALSCSKEKPAVPQKPQLPPPEYSTVTDVEGNIYKTVKIGDQIWMAENLKTHQLNDGTPVPYVTSNTTWADVNILEPMMCYYDNDDLNNKDKYGALYNWYAVNTGKLAPEGWHVATNSDWEKLKNYLIANGYNYDGTKSENKIGKALAATFGWNEDGTTGNVGNDQASNNKSGLSLTPGGYRQPDGTFSSTPGNIAIVWTPDSYSVSEGISPKILAGFDVLILGYSPKNYGYYVRCVKD